VFRIVLTQSNKFFRIVALPIDFPATKIAVFNLPGIILNFPLSKKSFRGSPPDREIFKKGAFDFFVFGVAS